MRNVVCFLLCVLLASCSSTPQPDIVSVRDGKREVVVVTHRQQPATLFTFIQTVLRGTANLIPGL